MSSLTAGQRNALNSLSPRLAAEDLDLGDLIDQILEDLTAGNLGITADAADVDSLALGGGHFSLDEDTTSGLTLGYGAGRFHNGLALVSVAAGTIALSASNTNYVEVNRAGTVSANTSGFTSGSLPLWTVTTGGSAISVVTAKKPLLQLIGLAGVVGSMLSSMGATKEVALNLGSISATSTFRLRLPSNVGTISKISFVPGTSIAASDTDYWTFGVVNKGAAGSGTTVVVDGTAAANSTKVTGGSALTANVKRDLTLTGTGADLIFAAGDVIEITVTKAASATTIAGASVAVDSTFTG